MATKKALKALIGGNWKANGTLSSVKSMAEALNKAGPFSPNSEIVIAAPSIHLQSLKSIIRPDIAVASQDISFKTGFGAFTGELTGDILSDSGIKWTLTGHSERRVGFGCPGETNLVVGKKTKNGVASGLSVIACIGEQLIDRQSGKTMNIVSEQLAAIAESLAIGDWKKVVLAYEPVWAIGTGVTATPEQAQETHANIREWLKKHVSSEVAAETRIIYGGSATAANAASLYAQPDINGFLVGGASLKPEFVQIINCTA